MCCLLAPRPWQNSVLDPQKSILSATDDLADRIAQQTLAARVPDYSREVRRLLDAGRQVMRRNGTTSRARVADIVAAAGVSNDAFYRHFASKDMLVAAILEDGTERLQSYLAHQMEKEKTPERQVRRWVEGVLAQAADEDAAATTLAVLWNAGSVTDRPNGPSASAPLATLLWEPFAQLGSVDPELDASLAAHAMVGKLSDFLRSNIRPSRKQTERLVAFCLRCVSAEEASARPATSRGSVAEAVSAASEPEAEEASARPAISRGSVAEAVSAASEPEAEEASARPAISRGR